MEALSMTEVLFAVNGLFMAIIGFFVRSLVTKIELTAALMAALDKNVALVSQKLDSQNTQIQYLYEEKKRIKNDIDGVNSRIHKLANSINEVKLLYDNCPARNQHEANS